jgi:hypothetical protein
VERQSYGTRAGVLSYEMGWRGWYRKASRERITDGPGYGSNSPIATLRC